MQSKFKSHEVEVKDNRIILHFNAPPIPPVKKVLKEKGFVNKKGVYSAAITENNKIFVRLLTGYVF